LRVRAIQAREPRLLRPHEDPVTARGQIEAEARLAAANRLLVLRLRVEVVRVDHRVRHVSPRENYPAGNRAAMRDHGRERENYGRHRSGTAREAALRCHGASGIVMCTVICRPYRLREMVAELK